MKKLLIFDSNSMINRAFYGIGHLSAKDGTPTNAVYGFMNILLKMKEEYMPDYICAAFDLKAPTFRHKMYDGYKAQRHPMPDDLRVQMPIAKELLVKMGIKILEIEGWEADDIIGTVSRICTENEVECYIVTGDRDDLQLANDFTKILLTVTKSGVTDTTVYDTAAVKEKFGVTPTEFIDIKALMGDQSDNIPGVKGIGEKTAAALISKYSSIDYIYSHLDELDEKAAVIKKLTEGRDMAYMSRKLAEIDTHVPIEFNIEDCRTPLGYEKEFFDALKRLSLNTIIRRLGAVVTEDTPTEATDDLFSNIQTKEGIDESLFGKCVSVLPVYADGKITRAYISDGDSVYTADGGDEAFLRLLEDENTPKIMFDAKELMVTLGKSDSVRNMCDDLAIASYLLDPARSAYTPEYVSSQYLDAHIEKQQPRQMSLFEEDTDENFYACCAYALHKARGVIADKLEQLGQTQLYREIELPLVRVLADMQLYGFRVDKEQLDRFGQMLGERIDVLVEKIHTLAGGEFNVNSPKQLGEVLFEKLGLKSIKKNARGYSTSADVLEKLYDKHEIVPLILDYRHLAKLKSTYCDSLGSVINPETGRIHSVFNQTVTVTGRISSTEPNLQNIPTRTEIGREMRKMFTASEEGRILVDADYSQIELRVLAHIARDDTMIQAFINGEDIHAVTASQVLGIPLEDVTPQQRSSAKAVNFGIVYGIGEYSLSQDLHISIGEARGYMKGYLEKYHGVREYMERIKEQAHTDGFVKTMMNRVRYIPEIRSTNRNIRAFGERVALNTPIQGTAADIIKLAMVRVHERLAKELPDARLILQVHDELIVDCSVNDADAAERILREEMENAVALSVPLTVDISRGRSWYDAK